MVDVGHSNLQAAQVGGLGLRVGSRLALTSILKMNRVNSRNDLYHCHYYLVKTIVTSCLQQN